MAKINNEEMFGKQLLWKGEYDLENSFHPEIYCTNREHNFVIEQFGIEIQIMLLAKKNTKEILITANESIEYEKLSQLLFDLFKYENLFDGRFYTTYEFSLDGTDIMPIIMKEWLPFYRSKIAYTYICLVYDNDDEYKELFLKWKDLCEKLDIIHQMFLYSSYSTDITPDVKLALLLQTFEPIADMLHGKGIINLEKSPYITKEATCDNCGKIISIDIKNKNLHFSDRLKAIVNKYGVGIFDNDKVDILLERGVNLRNKIVHLDISHPDTLSGKESGVYIHKFSLLYRNIILSELGLGSSGYNTVINTWIKDFDRRFGYCMIRQADD